MKKFLFVLIVMTVLVCPVFAADDYTDIQSLIGEGVDSSVTSPIIWILKALRTIAVVFIVAMIIWGAITYMKSDGSQRAEILKKVLTAVVVAAVLILMASKVPALLGLTNTTKRSSEITRMVEKEYNTACEENFVLQA